jgi:hypothetical protein
MPAIGAMLQRLLDYLIDANGFFAPAAGFALFLAQLFLMLLIAFGGLENRLISART